MSNVLSALPASFTAGDTITLQIASVSAYPSDSFYLKFILRGSSSKIDKSATAGASFWTITLSAAETAALAAGNYAWATKAVATDGTTTQFANGATVILPDLFVDQPISAQAKIVAALQAAITKLANKTATNVSVNGKSYSLLDIEKLYSLLRRAQADLSTEQATAIGKPRSHVIRPSFPVQRRYCR